MVAAPVSRPRIAHATSKEVSGAVGEFLRSTTAMVTTKSGPGRPLDPLMLGRAGVAARRLQRITTSRAAADDSSSARARRKRLSAVAAASFGRSSSSTPRKHSKSSCSESPPSTEAELMQACAWALRSRLSRVNTAGTLRESKSETEPIPRKPSTLSYMFRYQFRSEMR